MNGTCCRDLLVDVSDTIIVEIQKYNGLYHASETETTLNGNREKFGTHVSYFDNFSFRIISHLQAY